MSHINLSQTNRDALLRTLALLETAERAWNQIEPGRRAELNQMHHEEGSLQYGLTRAITAAGEMIDAAGVASDEPPLRFWAVTGRLPGDDEDTLHCFEAATQEDAVALFEEAIWEDETDLKRDEVFAAHGRTVFVNSIAVSDAPIETV